MNIEHKEHIHDCALIERATVMMHEFEHNLRCGFEIEADFSFCCDYDDAEDTAIDIIDSIKYDHCDSRGKVYDYEYNNPFMYAYFDGSVPVELVTSMLLRRDIPSVIARGIDILSDHDCEVAGGLHQTIRVAGDTELQQTVYGNIIALSRLYMPAMNWISTESSAMTYERGKNTDFRQYVYVDPDTYNGYRTDKYMSVNIVDGRGCVEFRYPDATDSISLISRVSDLNMAIVHHAYKMVADGYMYNPYLIKPDGYKDMYDYICDGYEVVGSDNEDDYKQCLGRMVDELYSSFKILGIDDKQYMNRSTMQIYQYWNYNRGGE